MSLFVYHFSFIFVRLSKYIFFLSISLSLSLHLRLFEFVYLPFLFLLPFGSHPFLFVSLCLLCLTFGQCLPASFLSTFTHTHPSFHLLSHTNSIKYPQSLIRTPTVSNSLSLTLISYAYIYITQLKHFKCELCVNFKVLHTSSIIVFSNISLFVHYVIPPCASCLISVLPESS